MLRYKNVCCTVWSSSISHMRFVKRLRTLYWGPKKIVNRANVDPSVFVYLNKRHNLGYRIWLIWI
jgi:hypothetical protein